MRSSREPVRKQTLLVPSCANNPAPAEGKLASRSELSAFLEGVERRAFKQAVFAVREEEAALDIVQDAMLRLAEKYGHRPAEGDASARSQLDLYGLAAVETWRVEPDRHRIYHRFG